ncbi:MAG TPA: ThuA domain-containing protein [Gemmatales bacterium]|nr:ThuA domain-containing protein [Gemmatales bacterium]
MKRQSLKLVVVAVLVSLAASGLGSLGHGSPLSPTMEPADKAAAPHVVFVTGDDEYRSEITMPMLARILEERHGFKCTVCRAVNPTTGQKEPKFKRNIAGLEALANADLAVFYLRFRELPPEQLERILEFVRSGKPTVGLRTTTHAFLYPADNPQSRWNDGFGIEVFGQKWLRHHGHDSSTQVSLAVRDHPICRGVPPEWHCRSWLYHVTPLVGDCSSIALGAAVKGTKSDGQRFGTANPVAWTKTHQGGRVFFTTLGHPSDFEHEATRRLVLQGIFWSLGREADIPEAGLAAEPLEPFVAPPTW